MEHRVRMSPGQESIVLRVKRQAQNFWSQQSRPTQIIRPIWKVKGESIEDKHIKWHCLVLVWVPLFNSSVVHPGINSWHLDSSGRRKNNLLRAFPEGLERLPPRSQCLYQDLSSWLKQWLAWLRGWVRSPFLEFLGETSVLKPVQPPPWHNLFSASHPKQQNCHL